MAQGTVLLQNLITFSNNEGKCMIVVIIIIYAIMYDCGNNYYIRNNFMCRFSRHWVSD